MSPANLEITEQDIEYAERILLPTGHHFDDERNNFIKNLETIDLQAVPGSGKTTALLAKILILEKYMPFDDGSGVLVISHTNAAVDEIKKRIGKHCPRLFAFPNFVGTIQSFVDRFLATPLYANRFKKKPIRIDNEIYHEKHYVPGRARGWLNRQSNYDALYESRLVGEDDLRYAFSGKSYPLKDKAGNTYQAILGVKQGLREKGFLCFDDAYILGFDYLERFPNVKVLLQKRFSFVFVDEMQDMDKHQYDILEKSFFDGGRSESFFQRIGDKNQAIFGGNVRLEDVWTNRRDVLLLNGSYRFHPKIAEVVKSFALSPIDIEGRRKNADDSEISIAPRVIVFDDDSIHNVLPTFAGIIKGLKDDGKFDAVPENIFKAVAWIATPPSSTGLYIGSYFSDFERAEHRPSIDYSALETYLIFYDKDGGTLEAIRKNILNAVLRVLRFEDIKDEFGRHFTKRKLSNYLKELHLEFYEDLKLRIYKWSIGVIRGEAATVLGELRAWIPDLLSVFNCEIDKSGEFIEAQGGAAGVFATGGGSPHNPNVAVHEDIEIEVVTVHSSKGQTHTATLYLETSFYSNHESSCLQRCFCGQCHDFSASPNTDKRKKQSLKMAYVGLSRPTHLLCFATHKDRFESHFSELDEDVWDVVKIYKN